MSSEISGYSTLSQAFPNSGILLDFPSEFATNHVHGLVYSASYASSYENYGIDENFETLSFVPVNNDPLPGYVSAQASSISNVEGQAPKFNTVPSSFVPHSTSRRKRNKRRFTEAEKAAIKNKRKVGVCADCRRTKRRVRFLWDYWTNRLKYITQCTHVLQHVPLESASIYENTSTSVKGGSSLGIGEIQEDGNSCEACRRRSVSFFASSWQ